MKKKVINLFFDISKKISKYNKYLCHGDLRCSNIMVYENELYVIDIAHLCFGTHYYDLASFLEDPTQDLSTNDKMDILTNKLKYDNNQLNDYFLVSLMNNLFCLATLMEASFLKTNYKIYRDMIKSLLVSIDNNLNLIKFYEFNEFIYLIYIVEKVKYFAKSF